MKDTHPRMIPFPKEKQHDASYPIDAIPFSFGVLVIRHERSCSVRILLISLCLAAVAALSVALAGCSSEPPAEKAPAAQSGHYEGDGHDHAGHEH